MNTKHHEKFPFNENTLDPSGLTFLASSSSMDTPRNKKPRRRDLNASTTTTSRRRRRSCFLACFGFSRLHTESNPGNSPSDSGVRKPREETDARNAAVLSITTPDKATTPRSVIHGPETQAQAQTAIPPTSTRQTPRLADAARVQMPADATVDSRNTDAGSPVSEPHGSGIPVRMWREVSRGPVAGLWIVTVTLVVMLVWGRLCAVLCTSALFCCGLRINKIERDGGGGGQGGDTNGEIDGPSVRQHGYNKQVVLEGFLRRDRRPSSAAAVVL